MLDSLPSIPDDATRIICWGEDFALNSRRLHYARHGARHYPRRAWGPRVYTDPDTARRALAESAQLRSHPVTADIAHLRHQEFEFVPIPDTGSCDERRLSVWEDGLLDVTVPYGPEGIPRRNSPEYAAWQESLPTAYSRSVADLLITVRCADNWPDLQRSLAARAPWLEWQGEAESTVIGTRTEESHPVPDTDLKRTVTLTCHSVRRADGGRDRLWSVEGETVGDRRPYFSGHRVIPHELMADHREVYTSEEEARGHFEEELPCAVTLAQAAPWLGTTYESLRKAVLRGQQDRERLLQTVKDPVMVPEYLTIFSAGRTKWYDPRELRRWYRSRPSRWPAGTTADGNADG